MGRGGSKVKSTSEDGGDQDVDDGRVAVINLHKVMAAPRHSLNVGYLSAHPASSIVDSFGFLTNNEMGTSTCIWWHRA